MDLNQASCKSQVNPGQPYSQSWYIWETQQYLQVFLDSPEMYSNHTADLSSDFAVHIYFLLTAQ